MRDGNWRVSILVFQDDWLLVLFQLILQNTVSFSVLLARQVLQAYSLVKRPNTVNGTEKLTRGVHTRYPVIV